MTRTDTRRRGGRSRAARSRAVGWAVVPLVGFVGAACGDDDDDPPAAAATTATVAATAAPTAAPPSAPVTSAATTGSAGAGSDYCAFAGEVASQESLPTAEQLESLRELAPSEIAEPAEAVVDALLPVAGDDLATFNAFAVDDVERAIHEINAYETEVCGIEHEDQGLPAGATDEIEADATRVDVVATDYRFTFDEPVQAGRTSFVLTNEGEEAHFVLITKLAAGVTLDEAMATEDSAGMIEAEWGSDLAAPGGEDEEVLTIDVEPGTYAMLCFVPGPTGEPHAFMGMTSEFVVE